MQSMEELLEFKWNNHRSTFINVLGQLRANQLYTDVTIACEGKFYNVHKLVLSMCSDYFSNLLSRTNCKNPVVVLKDVKSEDLEALLDYMYLGEVNVCQSDITTLTQAAETLKVKDIVTDAMEELLSLKWDNHQATFIDTLSQLRHNEQFADATLECEGRLYNVHRLVLSTCSDYFSDMLDYTNCKNPVIVLKDIRCRDLDTLLDYMYRGEVNIGQSDVETVVKAAECLQMKGLAVPDDDPPPTKSDDGGSEGEGRAAKRKRLSYDERYGGTLKEEGDSTDSGDSDSDDASNDAGNDISEFLQKTEPLSSFSGSSSQADHADGSGWQADGSTFGSTEGTSEQQQHVPVAVATPTPAPPPPPPPPPPPVKKVPYIPKHPKITGKHCRYCRKYFPVKADANEHHCPNIAHRPFKCPKCPYAASKKTTLRNHILTHKGEKPFKCPECPYASSLEAALDAHVREHKGGRPFKCPVCPYAAARKTHLQRHSQTHSGERPFKCNECAYSSTTKGTLDIHMRKHAKERQFKCTECSHTAASMAALNRHICAQADQIPFKCPTCPYQTVRKHDLDIHIRTHTGERPYKCPHCPHASARKSQLDIHIRTHTGERPFTCHLCPYTATQRATLNVHIRTHTGEQPHKCHLCSFGTSSNKALQNHLQVKHNIFHYIFL